MVITPENTLDTLTLGPLQLVADALPVAMYACDAAGRIVVFNQRAADLWGRAPALEDSSELFCGSYRLYTLDGRPIAHTETPMAEVLRSGNSVQGACAIVERPDGTRVIAEVTIAPLRGTAGQLVGAINCFQDITERKQAEDQLRQSRLELLDFFENAAEGLHWVGPDGTILWANPAELNLLGYSREEYLGRKFSDFHVDQARADELIERLKNEETVRDFEVQVRCSDGSVKHLLINSNVRWFEGQFIHTRCFSRDITERKRLDAELREAGRLKDEFLAMLAHELRNPLAPVRMAARVLKIKGAADPLVERQCYIIERQVENMARMLDDLLDMSRISRGGVRLIRAPVDLAEIVRNALEAVRPLQEAKMHALETDLATEPLCLYGDRLRLEQVVVNVLNNAVKYTDPGGWLWVCTAREGDAAVLRVRDNGLGIPAELLPHVFDLFRQEERGLARTSGGLGIGLSLVKNLVELHEGTVEAYSEGRDQGCEFTIRLPLHSPD